MVKFLNEIRWNVSHPHKTQLIYYMFELSDADGEIDKKEINVLFKIALAIGIGFASCDNCSSEDPRARIINNGTDKASVQIQTSGGNTENINNIASGTSSDHVSYAAGDIQFTITVDKTAYVLNTTMVECYEYDIYIDEDNSLRSVPTDRNS